MTLLTAIFLLGGLGMAQAKSNADIPEFHLPSFDVDAIGIDLTQPIPLKADPPAVHEGLKGTEVTMTFYISESGRVTQVEDDSSPYNNEEFELACLMHRQLRTWKFDPARDVEGNAVAVKVIMPVMVIEKGELRKSELASISVKRPAIVAVAKR